MIHIADDNHPRLHGPDFAETLTEPVGNRSVHVHILKREKCVLWKYACSIDIMFCESPYDMQCSNVHNSDMHTHCNHGSSEGSGTPNL